MGLRRSFARFLVLFCLLALQAQLLASSAIPCRNLDGAGEGNAATCMVHLGATVSRGVDQADAVLDCQRCILGLFFGTCHQVTSAPSSGLSGFHPVEVGSGLKHFYRFVPDRLYRPPILLQS